MKYRFWILPILVVLTHSSCSPVRSLFNESKPVSQAQQEYIDSLMSEPQWEVPSGKTTYPAPRTWDLIHQNIEVRVEQPLSSIKGVTELFLVSRGANDSLVLDARHIQVQRIRNDAGEELKFKNDSSKLILYPEEPAQRSDTLAFSIDYRAGGSGSLQFINPPRQQGHSFPQVWTSSGLKRISGWLPTIARPDEKATANLWISVPDSMETVASGKLIERKKWGGDSLRTDYWAVNRPVPIHNLGWTAGILSDGTEIHNDKVFNFYAAPAYKDQLPLIYKETGEVLKFLQAQTGLGLSWPAYHMVPLQRHPAMGEGLAATSFVFEEAQFDKRASMDVNNTAVLIQLLARQLTDNHIIYDKWEFAGLQEGLIRQFVYMYYRQNPNISAKASYQRARDYERYYAQADTLRRSLLNHSYGPPYEMRDAHWRFKSAAFWNMLRHRVGDEAFMNGLQNLLASVEPDSERPNLTLNNVARIFGEVSGHSLQNFIDQWLQEPGHPRVSVETSVVDNQLLLTFNQVQKDPQPVFELQPEVDIVMQEDTLTVSPFIQTADTTFNYRLSGKLRDVIVDPEEELLAEWNRRVSKSQALNRLGDQRALVRLDALERLNEFKWDDSTQNALMEVASADPFGPVRNAALKLLARHSDAEIKDFAMSRNYGNEQDSRVRITALHLAARDTTSEGRHYLKKMVHDSSYFVSAEAIKLYARTFPEQAYPEIRKAGVRPSYRNVLKAGLAQGLRYIDSEQAREDLYRMASRKGYDQYIADAMESLAYQLRNYSIPQWRSKIVKLYANKSTSAYPEIKNKAGRLMESFQSRPEEKTQSSCPLRPSIHLTTGPERNLISRTG